MKVMTLHGINFHSVNWNIVHLRERLNAIINNNVKVYAYMTVSVHVHVYAIINTIGVHVQ